MKAATALIFALCVATAVADVYMMNPRGSNDRNCEKNVNRNNGNRMFDSQNNAKGGYACPRREAGAEENPKQFYYVGSKLAIEWTNQHGCGPNEKVGCEVILQHACEDTLDPTGQYRAGANVGTPRDGTPTNANDDATDTIPNNANNAVANNAANRRFGMHESQEYYAACQTRQRNKGLYTADQNVNRNDARGTRQNPNGNRNGLECPEERDYYPYWHPTPWSDIAVLTSDTSRCAMYKAESQNVKPKGVCVNGASKQQAQNNKAACEAAGNTWAEVRYHVKYNAATSGTKDITTPPVCANNQVSRVNQLGNAAGPIPGDDPAAVDAVSEGLYANRYVWTIPDKVNENCVLRLRYNISTADFTAWGENAVNASFNGAKSPVKQDPYVKIGAGNNDILSLAVNTNQYARTFQDRSYVYAVKARPAGVGTGVIFNLNTVGKRGNIVQTYPATEYNFHPNILNVPVGSNIHVMVTGSDYNPRRGCNNGEGGPPSPPNNGAANNNARADRSNFIEVGNLAHNVPADISTAAAAGAFTAFVDAAGQPDMATINRLAFLDQKKQLAANNQECLTETQLNNINNNNRRENNLLNCAKLNAVKYPVADLGVITLRKAGVFGYMSSRNNNFSNRDQTSALCVGAAEECATLSNADAAPGGAPGVGAPSAPVYQLPVNEPGPPKMLDPETDVKAPEDRDNDAVGDGEMKGCENQIWDLIQGMGPFGAAILGVGMFAMGVAAALFVGWWARRNSGAGRTDQAWMSTPHSSL